MPPPADAGPEQAEFAELLRDAGADPNARAALRESSGPGVRVQRDVTPLAGVGLSETEWS